MLEDLHHFTRSLIAIGVFDTLASDQRFRPLVGAARFAALVAECKTRIGGWADYNED